MKMQIVIIFGLLLVGMVTSACIDCGFLMCKDGTSAKCDNFTKECVCPKEAAKAREECGWLNISKSECDSRGCFFDNSIKDVIWCFNKPDCPLDKSKRSECGFPNITQSKCEARGCRFDNSTVGVNWCFPDCNLPVNCGPKGITKQACNAKGCKFDDSVKEVFWCTRKAECNQDPSKRRSAGAKGIKKEECESGGFCFDDSTKDVPWCYLKNSDGNPRSKDGSINIAV
jgi:hypothetical protein